MTGQQVYTAFFNLYALRGVEIDAWESLDEVDREVWNELAESLL